MKPDSRNKVDFKLEKTSNPERKIFDKGDFKMLRKLRTDKSGFTLIELMIVVAIIGILAAIAIPNYVRYRNNSICSSIQSDANSVAAAISDYFSNEDHTTVPAFSDLTGVSLGKYTASVTPGGSPNTGISIVATPNADGYRCPRANSTPNAHDLAYSITMGAQFGHWR